MEQHRTFDAMSAILGWILGLVKKEFPDFTLEGKRALEIGTGKYLNHPLGLYICGCDSVFTVDVDNQLENIAKPLKDVVLARRFLSDFVSDDVFNHRLSNIKDCLSHPLAYLTRLVDIGISHNHLSSVFIDVISAIHPFDFVFSYATLEHVQKPPATLDIAYNALKPGGICAHFVDLEDHRDPVNEPFAFLSEPEWESENRLRESSWLDLFREYGMDCRFPYLAERRNPKLPNIHPSVKYESESDLRTTAFLMVGRKLHSEVYPETC